jgi:hypothetical protein
VEKCCGTRRATVDNIILRMRIARWITTAARTHTHTHSEYVILIAFPLQQWLRTRVSILRFTYVGVRRSATPNYGSDYGRADIIKMGSAATSALGTK